MAATNRKRRTVESGDTTASPFPKIEHEGVEVIPVVRHMRPVRIDRAKAEELGQSFAEPTAGEDQGTVRVMLTNENVRHVWNEISGEQRAMLLDPEHRSGKGPLVRLDAVPVTK